MDHRTIGKLMDGDEEVRTEIYRAFRMKLYRYCFHLLGNRSDAEDAVHATFLKIFNGINGLQSAGAFRSWIYTIARNESLQLMRKSRPVVLFGKDEIADSETLEQQIDANDISRIIRAEIDALKPEYREVIFLREYHHLSYAELAKVLQTTESSVKNMLFRARKCLYEKLKPYFDEGRKHDL